MAITTPKTMSVVCTVSWRDGPDHLADLGARVQEELADRAPPRALQRDEDAAPVSSRKASTRRTSGTPRRGRNPQRPPR